MTELRGLCDGTQRLRLASVSPALRDVCENDNMTLGP
jgi:hypothetical protein